MINASSEAEEGRPRGGVDIRLVGRRSADTDAWARGVTPLNLHTVPLLVLVEEIRPGVGGRQRQQHRHGVRPAQSMNVGRGVSRRGIEGRVRV